MKKFVAASIVFLFGIWLGQPAMTSFLDINQVPPAVETAGDPDFPLEDEAPSQQQTFDEEEEEKKMFTVGKGSGSDSSSAFYYLSFLNHYSDVSLGILLPPPELV